MQVIPRHLNQSAIVVIGDVRVRVTPLAIVNGRVQLGFDLPAFCEVRRGELSVAIDATDSAARVESARLALAREQGEQQAI